MCGVLVGSDGWQRLAPQGGLARHARNEATYLSRKGLPKGQPPRPQGVVVAWHFCHVTESTTMLKSSLITALLAFSGLMAQAQTTPATPAAPAKPATPAVAASAAKPAAAAKASTTPAPEVKKSSNGICHDQSSPSFKQLKKFTEFKTMDECIKSGGRAPKAAKK